HAADDLREAMAEIDALIANGMLFFDECAREDASPERRGAVIKAMCLHAAHDCNMRCAYCFGDEGSFSGSRSLLSEETGRRAIDFLLEHSGGRRNLEIDFFGGEPLMNFAVVQALVRYGREREKDCGKYIRFTVTTNGLLLDEEKEGFINEHMDNVILSIDGRPEVNDRVRKTPSGEGTYRRVIGNFERFRESRRDRYYVRGTFTAKNKDFSEDVKHLADRGFTRISVEPVVLDGNRDCALRESDLPELLSEYDRLTDLYLDRARKGRPFSFFHFDIDLNQGPCVYKRAAGCGAGTEYIAVSPEGDIYPCHRFVGERRFKLGNVADEAFENDLYPMFNRAHIYSKEACAGCWAKFYCSGGCHANAWHENGDILKPYALGCALEKKRLECAIAIRVLRAT
ncbi:MAG: thioether cross-link-forming SCIFF peptide maturase, partial [Clostridiales Family XIII bacterium]|nr:thioether cross-link-forming SCIFF peptide maturase [Clostridiales Family XIII bacterium]